MVKPVSEARSSCRKQRRLKTCFHSAAARRCCHQRSEASQSREEPSRPGAGRSRGRAGYAAPLALGPGLLFPSHHGHADGPPSRDDLGRACGAWPPAAGTKPLRSGTCGSQTSALSFLRSQLQAQPPTWAGRPLVEPCRLDGEGSGRGSHYESSADWMGETGEWESPANWIGNQEG